MNRIITIAVVAIGLHGTAMAQKIARQYDRSADFSKYQTVKWVTVEGSGRVNEMLERDIRNVVNAELKQKGLVPVDDSGPADLYVAYQATGDKQKELNWYNSGGSWGWGGGWGGGMGSASTSTINVGTLALDFYDAAQHKMIWRGTATKTLNPSGNAEKTYQNLQKAVAKLLKEFPPTAKK